MDIWEEMTNKNKILRKFRTFFNFVIFLNFGMKIGEILVEKRQILVRKSEVCLRGLQWPPEPTRNVTLYLNRPTRVCQRRWMGRTAHLGPHRQLPVRRKCRIPSGSTHHTRFARYVQLVRRSLFRVV